MHVLVENNFNIIAEIPPWTNSYDFLRESPLQMKLFAILNEFVLQVNNYLHSFQLSASEWQEFCDIFLFCYRRCSYHNKPVFCLLAPNLLSCYTSCSLPPPHQWKLQASLTKVRFSLLPLFSYTYDSPQLGINTSKAVALQLCQSKKGSSIVLLKL